MVAKLAELASKVAMLWHLWYTGPLLAGLVPSGLKFLHPLTYETRFFITLFTDDHQLSLFWATWIHSNTNAIYSGSIYIYIYIIYFNPFSGLPSCQFLSGSYLNLVCISPLTCYTSLPIAPSLTWCITSSRCAESPHCRFPSTSCHFLSDSDMLLCIVFFLGSSQVCS